MLNTIRLYSVWIGRQPWVGIDSYRFGIWPLVRVYNYRKLHGLHDLF